MRQRPGPMTLFLLASVGLILTGCATPAVPKSGSGPISAVGAENEYANVISLIGGRNVRAVSLMSNPAVDPHEYEASAQDAEEVARASLIVQNGVGYDGFMNDLENASPSKSRIIITVGKALGYGSAVKNPHLWYRPGTMTKVAGLVAKDLERLRPSEKRTFQKNLRAFDASLRPWLATIAAIKARYSGSPVAVTEPVADDLLQAAGLRIATPWAFQAAVMNGTDPSPQAAAAARTLLVRKSVKIFVYNRQAVDATTQNLLAIARREHIPVVGVYETMPPHMTYPTWMQAEARAILRALEGRGGEATLP